MQRNVLILFGGTSSEYPVSLQSAAAVMDAIDTRLYTPVPVGITRQGQWLLYPGGTEGIRADEWFQNPACQQVVLSPSREDHGLWVLTDSGVEKHTVDIAFPVLHGKGGEDGTLQGLLELSGIPFAGCGSLCSALCMDKALSHNLAAHAGLAVPRFATVYSSTPMAEALQQVQTALQNTPPPWFVKPACEGSSFGITRVESLSELELALHTAFRFGTKAVVEEGIEGMEVGCAVLGNDQPMVGIVDGIELHTGFFDYHEKYNLTTAKILLPAPVSAATMAEIQNTALTLYRLFECRGFARVDMFLTPGGEIIFNEINTIPGFTAHSRYPAMLGAAGLSFTQIITKLLELAVQP